MTSPLAITPATAHDIPAIIALARHIWPTAYQGILTPPQIANMLERIYTPENLQAEMAENHRFWLARQNDIPAGYVSSYKENDAVWIKKIYVSPAMQGKSIGSKLIETATSAWLPVTEIKLLVNPHNTPAQRFYEHVGFTKIGSKPVRMGDWNFDDFVYSKPVK